MSSPSSHGRRRRRRRCGNGTAPPLPQAAEEARDWASLPRDIVLDIFLRLGPREVMLGAEFVCRPWRAAALEEPTLWRRVGMESVFDKHWRYRDSSVETAMKFLAVDRAAGQCETFQGVLDDDSLLKLVERAPSLKRLCISGHYSDDDTYEDLVEALKKLPLLEELEVNFKDIIDDRDENMLQSICQACPRLKKLVLMFASTFDLECNEDEYLKETIDGEIPVMPKLHTLELWDCDLEVKGLKGILNNCPELETLHIDGCFDKRKMDKELHMKCTRVKNLILPTRKRSDIYSDEDFYSSDTDSQNGYSDDDDSTEE